MKPALQFIPTEVWVDVFRYPGKSRKELGKIVDQIGNRKFAEFLQFYLHEWGKRTLGYLNFEKNGIYKSIGCAPYIDKLDFVQTPMPENIKFFKRLEISHFDSSTIDFLHQISKLFNGVNLRLYFGLEVNKDLANLRTILAHLSPLIHGIHSMELDHHAIPLVEQYLAPKQTQINMLSINLISLLERFDPTTFQTGINFCMNWLTLEERDSTEPRYLDACIYSENFQQFSIAVQKQFLSVKSPCTFTIGFYCYGNIDQVANFHLENNLGEQLDGQFNTPRTFQIYRHKVADSAREQLQEWVNNSVEKSHESSGIELYRSTTIGTLNANADANEVDENAGEEEKNQPSTSKKPKLA